MKNISIQLKRLAEQGKKIILYGTGTGGNYLYELLTQDYHIPIHCFCDSDKRKQKTTVHGFDVISPAELLSKYTDDVVILTPMTNTYVHEMHAFLMTNQFHGIVYTLGDLIGNDIVQNRNFCADVHKSSDYFDQAESENNLAVFWNDDSPFFNLFKNLDLNNVVELACGRGRHVPRYINKSNHITLVDILQENIDFCKTRFASSKNLTFYKNNGYDLCQLDDNTYTSLFTYDAVVHFEAFDVYNYIKETYRILKDGGYALFHHSNNSSDYRACFYNGIGGRAFMSMNLFAYFAYKVGFEIVEQKIIDWNVKSLDGITLLRKNTMSNEFSGNKT